VHLDGPAIQDAISGNLCFGCGADNPRGLRIKSHWVGEESVCVYHPEPHHCAGPPHVVNGGILATLIDCHCVCSAISDAYRREGREVGTAPPLWYVTGGLSIRYLRPTPIDHPIELRARITEATTKKTVLECTLSSNGESCATAEVVAIRVSRAWTSGAEVSGFAAGNRG